MIAESAADRLWGSGRSLGDPLCLDTTNWISQGLLGRILESIREEFAQTIPPMYASTTQTRAFHSRISQPIADPSVNYNPLPRPMDFDNISKPVPIPQQPCNNQDPTSESTTTDESSASSTPVSDTTATDTDNTTASNIPS